jgi:hypothetical protein
MPWPPPRTDSATPLAAANSTAAAASAAVSARTTSAGRLRIVPFQSPVDAA